VFQFFDHTGDIGVDIDAPDVGSLFADAARAFTDAITDREALCAEGRVQVALESDALDLLLVDWLNELLYRFETSGWLPRDADPAVERGERGWSLVASATGGRLDPERQEVRVLIKAVTYHALDVREDAGRWRARVIFDI
jgi:SHS2 domain-containing protein